MLQVVAVGQKQKKWNIAWQAEISEICGVMFLKKFKTIFCLTYAKNVGRAMFWTWLNGQTFCLTSQFQTLDKQCLIIWPGPNCYFKQKLSYVCIYVSLFEFFNFNCSKFKSQLFKLSISKNDYVNFNCYGSLLKISIGKCNVKTYCIFNFSFSFSAHESEM